MIAKVLIIYLILLYIFHKITFFNYFQKILYSDFYVKDKINMRALLYEPYNFSDIRNIIMSTLATPYGLTIVLMTFMTTLFGYISTKWYCLFIILSYFLLIISHYVFYTQNVGWVPVFLRLIFFFIPIMNIVFGNNEYIDKRTGLKTYGKDNLTSISVLLLSILIYFVVSYNYISDLGKYDVKNKEDYKKIYKGKWVFTSLLLPIYISLFVILRNMNVTNTVVISFFIGFLFTLSSYILY